VYSSSERVSALIRPDCRGTSATDDGTSSGRVACYGGRDASDTVAFTTHRQVVARRGWSRPRRSASIQRAVAREVHVDNKLAHLNDESTVVSTTNVSWTETIIDVRRTRQTDCRRDGTRGGRLDPPKPVDRPTAASENPSERIRPTADDSPAFNSNHYAADGISSCVFAR
jgi:hypothetical protein